MSLAAILSTQPKSAPIAAEMRIPLLDRYAKAHPAADAPEIEHATLPEALTRKFRRDQHFAAYAASIPHRLSGESLATTTAAMQLAVFDVDDPGKVDGHAREEWREAERTKISRLVDLGLFAYLTRGGYRLVGRLDEPITISSTTDAAKWRATYLSWCQYLTRVHQIAADTACQDFSRLFRIPHGTRERGQEPEALPTYGDPENIGTWAPELAPEDIVQPEAAPQGARAVTPGEGGEDPGARIAPLGIRVAHALIAAENLPPSVSGQRGHDALLVAASTIRNGFALPRDVAHNLLETVFNPRCSPVWTSREISHKIDAAERSDEGWGERIAGILISETAEDVLRQRRREPANENGAAFDSAAGSADQATGAIGTKHPAFALTETGNAERLVHRHAHALRYVTTWHKWIAWDGRRWSVEGADALVQQATKETVRSFDKEIARLDDDQRSLLRKWAIKSETRQARDAMISLARHEAVMTIERALTAILGYSTCAMGPSICDPVTCARTTPRT